MFNRPALIVCNHKSSVDPPALISFLSKFDARYSFVAKTELKSSSFFNKYTDLVHTIYLNRENLRDIYESYSSQLKAIDEQRSVIIFPEGTIFKDDELGEFRPGALKLAYDKKIPIITMSIYGSSGLNSDDLAKECIDKHRNVYVTFDKVYEYDDFKEVDSIALANEIQERLQAIYLKTKNEVYHR